MFRKLTILLVLAALGLSAGLAQAYFEDTVISPRSRAMGESAVAVPDAQAAAFLNPAYLAEVSEKSFGAAYVQPFRQGFNDFYYLGGALPIHSRWGNFGFGLSSFQVEYQDVDLLKETQLSLAHGVNLFQDMHSSIDFGWSLGIYNVDLGETIDGEDPGSATAYGVDIGMLVTLHKRTKLGFQVKNINNPNIGFDEEELAQRLVGGVSYEPYDGVITTFEIENELGNEVQYHGGTEFYIIDGFALRTGIATNPNRLTGGFGYTFDGFTLHYGFSTGGGVLESNHQFGLNFAWGGEAP
ncbi:MAG: hypothetical protein KOO60_10110 [Gemmatimonadales bacterium]|nr:hypothetical protein [Gemmatimonadales bacterium]